MQALVQVQDLCARVEAERSAAAREAEAARSWAAELEDSIAFRLGSLLLAARSVKGLVGLPAALMGLVRHWRARGRPPRRDAPQTDSAGAPTPALAGLPGADIVRAWHVDRRPAPPESMSGLRVAAVVDQFTEACFAPDCKLLNLSGSDVEQQLDEFQPHLLFVESAWRGKAGDWMHKVHPCSGELRRLVDACRRRAIPTVFWSKEDPSHFDNFIEAAALFDYVFTTDADCVPRYRERLGHDRVDVLGFACQPAIHNPVEQQARRMAASFAGSWYAKYPERARDFSALADAVQQVVPVEIYDRNHERSDPAFAYPEKYRSLIKGGVPYERIADVYKGCEFGITVNTITDSPTMFARRVFELLACNTITVSNYSVGLDRMFGDIVVMAGRDDVSGRLSQLTGSHDARQRLRLRGLRQVMARHTAALRLAEVAATVLGPVPVDEPRVSVVAQVDSQQQLARVLAMFAAQQWEHKELLLVGPDSLRNVPRHVDGTRFVNGGAAIASEVPEAGWLSAWHHSDYYGPFYLLDMMHATHYSNEKVIGKSGFFRKTDGGLHMRNSASSYCKAENLPARSAIVARELVANIRFIEIACPEGLEVKRSGLAIDEYSYCMGGEAVQDSSAVDVTD